MKALSILVLIAVAALIACNLPVAKGRNGASFTNAVAYNNYIVERQTEVVNRILAISEASEKNMDSTEQLLHTAVQTADSFLLDVKALSAYKGDSTFRNSAISMLTFYHQMLEKDFPLALAIQRKGPKMTIREYRRLGDIQRDIEEVETERNKRFYNAQQEFAQRNGLKLAENDLQRKLAAL